MRDIMELNLMYWVVVGKKWIVIGDKIITTIIYITRLEPHLMENRESFAATDN